MTFVNVPVINVWFLHNPNPPSHIVSMFRSQSSLKSGTGRSAFVTCRSWVTIGVAEQKMRLFFYAFWQTDWEKHVSCQTRATTTRNPSSSQQWQEERICFNSGYKQLWETIENNTDSNANERSHMEMQEDTRQRSSSVCNERWGAKVWTHLMVLSAQASQSGVKEHASILVF